MSLQFNAGGARGGCCLADGGDTGLAVSGAAKARDHMAKSMALAERASRGRIPTAKPSLFSLYRFTLTYARFPLPLAVGKIAALSVYEKFSRAHTVVCK